MTTSIKTFEVRGDSVFNDTEDCLRQLGVDVNDHEEKITEFSRSVREDRGTTVSVRAKLHTSDDGHTTLISLAQDGVRSEDAAYVMDFGFRAIKGKPNTYICDASIMDKLLGYVCARHGCDYIEPTALVALNAIKTTQQTVTIKFHINRTLRVISGFSIL